MVNAALAHQADDAAGYGIVDAAQFRRLLGDLAFLLLHALLQIIVGLARHSGGEAHVALHHLDIGVGDVDVTAAQFAFHRAIGHGDALMHAQVDVCGRVGGDPQPAGAEERARGDGYGVVLFVGYVALGHLAGKPAEDGLDRLRTGGILLLAGAKPQELVVEPGEYALHVVFTVVLVHQMAGQGHGGLRVCAKAGDKRLVQGDQSFREFNENYL